MRYRTFFTFNVVGGAIWSLAGILLGYGLGKRFPQLETYITPIIVLIIFLSLIPVFLEVRKSRVRAKARA
jgi:membrane-associated protein